jgi:hypothetical protein
MKLRKKQIVSLKAKKQKLLPENNSKPQVIRETRTVYRDRNSNSGGGNGTYADNGSSASQGTTRKKE